MKSKKTIERFGGLTKVEPLACIDDNILMPDSCVLESVAPFPGIIAMFYPAQSHSIYT